MKEITFDEFRNLKNGDVVFVKCGNSKFRSKVLGAPFYNHDSDEPGWEVETTNGFCDQYSIYVEKVYIYEGHLGSLYSSATKISDNDLRCEQCGDRDCLIGTATTREEAWELLKPITNINNSGGWDYDYVQEFLDEAFQKDDT